jgi:pyruvate ferredoxin oxidoreductase gamma subunit
MGKDNLIEIRWCGRGGQGAVTAAKMLAESALAEGKFIQAFPEFGPERMGAPVKSFTRISDKPINLHCQITAPDVSVLLDPTLLDVVDITEGVKKNGIIIVNTKDSPAELRKRLGLKDRKVYTVDASGISQKALGKNIPNTPMVAAVVKAVGILAIDGVIRNFQEEYSQKFKPEVVKANIEAMRAAYDEVKGEDSKS